MNNTKYSNFYKVIFILLFQVGFFSLQAQEAVLKGIITDTLQKPLEYTNVLAIPQVDNQNIIFSITNQKGEYLLRLLKNTPYKIEISYLGYQKISYPITLQENTSKDFKLIPISENLEEVIIRYDYQPVIVKKDTIIYKTDVFTTGEERKLREVLKKLPGIAVDKKGNVTVNGKKVNKFMVDGKIFFTGDTKLGVNNIPADVVDKVEVLDNYTDIPFLKGLNDSDILALNIKLKAGKKKFIFGDINAGAGIKKRYVINPTLFYYSPKTSINFIGDLNNLGEKAFTFQDYINFEGGFAKLIESPSSYSNIFNGDFAKFLTNSDFIFNKNSFGAMSVAQQFSAKTNLNAYSIVDQSKIETKTYNQNTYLTNNQITDIEQREINTKTNSTFSIHKLTFQFTPSYQEDVKYNVVVKTAKGNINEFLESLTLQDSNFVNSKVLPNNFEMLQNFEYSKQFSFKHTTTIQAQFNFSDNKNQNNWQFNNPVFNDIIPFQSHSPAINFLQNIKSKNYTISSVLKHYWVLNNFNHIYPKVGFTYLNQNYNTTDYQLHNNSIIDFTNAGFNNQTRFGLFNPFIGFQYKAKAGDVILKPGLVYHYFSWNVSQFSNEEVSKTKGLLLPEFLLNWEIHNSEKLSFKYKANASFSDVSFFANRLRLLQFNNLYKGNEYLTNSLSHQASLTYFQFNLLKGIFINAGLHFTKNVKSVRNSVLLEGINQINTSTISNLPENLWSFTSSISKKIKKIKYTLNTTVSLSDYSRIINENKTDFNSNNYTYLIKAETFYKKFPNLEIGFSQTFNLFNSNNSKNKFSQINPFINLDYQFLNAFRLQADYNYTYYQSKNNNTYNSFQIGNASLFYNKEDSAWGFEISLKNAFDVKTKNQNSFNQFLISDNAIFIQPRTIAFKLSYKL